MTHHRSSRGFTLVEVVIAIVLAGVLAAIAVRPFGAARDRFGADQGRLVFASMLARARAAAIETGAPTSLHVDTGADSVSISRGAVILETVHFDEELEVDIVGSNLTICMGPRGYAIQSCNSFNAPTQLEFERGGHGRVVELLPLGQLIQP